jgi:hypothetical protein
VNSSELEICKIYIHIMGAARGDFTECIYEAFENFVSGFQ